MNRRRFIGWVSLPLAGSLSANEPRVLRVISAIALADLIRSVGSVFEKRHPGLKVEVEAMASDIVAARLNRRPIVDVVIASDEQAFSKFVLGGFVDRFRIAPVAGNSMVIVSQQKLESHAQLFEERFKKIMLPDPSLTASGRYAREAMVIANLYNELQPKLVLGRDSREPLDFLSAGEVEAAVIYKSDLATKKGRGLQTLPLPGSVTHLIAPTRRSANPSLANEFVEYCRGDSVRFAMRQLNFEVPRR